MIVYFLPFDKRIPKSNKTGRNASEAWAMAYIETNRLIVNINTHLAAVLEGMGFESVVLPPTHNFDTDKLISDWSHKHVAYIAGLGNFGEHHLLITDKGCCGRLGSIITSAKIPPSQRSEAAYCLEKYGKSCGVCVEKCPTGALRPDGFDRHACYDLLLENADIFEEKGLADVCGKCSCIVPCSFKNPVAKLAANETKAE
ncbi:epoxyqueuosine reductase [Desulfonema ishimotonii]|uniref:Epoxyqueuosine reductase n=1 Tax=Desulfonema ishimotonii TaxID=45657 RepID=A0A401FWA8_9BACT|nr:4Fe-4S binding protein [Desulfonema ishimotonii]GBC61224.1 epoxyqueuosine reductase [Desulfonema ishimotonii]